jgi:hypothetical protein
LTEGPTLIIGAVLLLCVEHGGITRANEFGANNGAGNMFIVRFDEAKDEQASP